MDGPTRTSPRDSDDDYDDKDYDYDYDDDQRKKRDTQAATLRWSRDSLRDVVGNVMAQEKAVRKKRDVRLVP